jgi:hypothetical protein
MAHLVITLYDPKTNEVIKEYTRTFVPWKLLKRAVKLSKHIESFSANELSEEVIDELAALVVDTFGNQFSVDQLSDGADIGEMMTVLTGIMASAQGTVPNQPPREKL